MQLIIDTAQTTLSVKNKSFFIKNKEQSSIIGTKRLSSIAILTNCDINASAIKLAANNQIPIYIYNNFGTLQARFCSPHLVNLAQLRRKQLYFYNSIDASNWVIDTLLQKTNMQIQLLKQITQRQKRKARLIENNINKITELITKVKQYKGEHIDKIRLSLLGIEGNIARQYFSALSIIIPVEFKFEKRSRRPAIDYFNGGLNYLYGMTYSIVESGIYAKGLDPYTGYMHTDYYSKTSLVFDLIEPVRPLIDKIWIQLITEKKIKPEHFSKKDQGYWLNKEGKRIVIPSFNQYLSKRVKLGEEYYSLKTYIYKLSNNLGNLIDKTIDLEDVILSNL
jgi:CRISPR-associated protein Cas1